jgi:hypothetical protein
LNRILKEYKKNKNIKILLSGTVYKDFAKTEESSYNKKSIYFILNKLKEYEINIDVYDENNDNSKIKNNYDLIFVFAKNNNIPKANTILYVNEL